ncbi:hypothetical protein HGRIS_010697 [Hohenbuehelia grisea]|uniref:Ribosomal RNA-processing protein 42 n=1 Tax=Hohenbuehelia grisea TaxID=104357 RepID=A0ABR3IXS9_9AGAR
MSLSKAEKSYIQTGLLSNPPLRGDGRTLDDFRPIALETGVAPLANGSAKLIIGQDPHGGGGGTEVLAATKLEVENVQDEGADGGRVVCSVTCSPTAYPNLSPGALDDLQYDMTTILHQTLFHPSLHPPNLGIIPGRKSWLLSLDLVILSDTGNVYDALFMAARAALWDTKVPRTRSVEYKARQSGRNAPKDPATMDVDPEEQSGFATRKLATATDFELADYWDEGEDLGGRSGWPVAITLNLVSPTHFLDASPPEDSAAPQKVLLAFSFPESSHTKLQAIRSLGSGELNVPQLKELIATGEKYAKQLFSALNSKLKEEDIRRSQKARDRFAKR